MARARKIFAVHPGEVLKTEFMEPMGAERLRTGESFEFCGNLRSDPRGARDQRGHRRSSGKVFRPASFCSGQLVWSLSPGVARRRDRAPPRADEAAGLDRRRLTDQRRARCHSRLSAGHPDGGRDARSLRGDCRPLSPYVAGEREARTRVRLAAFSHLHVTETSNT